MGCAVYGSVKYIRVWSTWQCGVQWSVLYMVVCSTMEFEVHSCVQYNRVCSTWQCAVQWGCAVYGSVKYIGVCSTWQCAIQYKDQC